MHHYVIVGAGAAGCVLARRLSEDPDARVLLLEAREKPRGAAAPASPPLAHGDRPALSERDICYSTAPQEHLFERTLHWPRPEPSGGSNVRSNVHDGTIVLRGHRTDYDGWAVEHGCAGWSYAEVLPYFKRLERNVRGVSRYQGAGGLLPVFDLAEPHPLTQALVHASVEAGMPYNPDFNGAELQGVGLHQFTQSRERTHGAAAAYLAPARQRENLTVMTGAHVRRIDLEDGRATGVIYEEDGFEWSAEASEEVIVCAGAVASPHLLLRSGIGPAGPLRDRDVPVECDLPGVGQNLQDHLAVPVCQGVSGAAPSPAAAPPWGRAARHLLASRVPLACSAAEASVFFRTRGGPGAPDVQLHATPLSQAGFGLDDTEGEALALTPALLQPRSRGHLSLRPDGPDGPPVVQPRYCSDPEGADLAAFVAAIRTARRIFAQRSFAPHRAEELLPGLERTTDEELRAYIRLHAETLCHPAGTCAMGTGPGAVVDPALRVRGVEGLRVADASVMPRIPRGSTDLPTIMIAEKAADVVLGRPPLPAAEVQQERAKESA